MLKKDNPFGGFDPDLLACAFRNAGSLVVAEHFEGGGWSVIWKDDESGKFTSLAMSYHTDNAIEFVALAGYLAEALAGDGSVVSAIKEYEKAKGVELDQVTVKMVGNILRGAWDKFEQYAESALEQWDKAVRLGPDHESLPYFNLSATDIDVDALEKHQLPAMKKGVKTPASLVQCGGPELAIPDCAIVKEARS